MGRAHHHEVSAAMSQLLDSLLTPQQRAQADRIGAAMMQLSGLLAERAVLETATRALDVSRRAAFEAIRSDAAPIKQTPADSIDDGLTSLQPLGDAQVMVCYSSDGDGLDIDGASINGEFVHIDCFTAEIRGQWYRAIKAEERKDAEIESWFE